MSKLGMVLICVLLLAMVLTASILASREKAIQISPYPLGFRFAFTIDDDPDDGWLAEKRAIYGFLDSIGMKTSIGVWVADNKEGSGVSSYYDQGISLANQEYLAYIHSLHKRGFEIFLHTATGGNDTREDTIRGFETYKKYFGVYPDHWVNHWTNRENIYWGYKRFSNRFIRYAIRLMKKNDFEGDEATSRYFWGDQCEKYIKYVRGWASGDLNTLGVNPSMPYHDPTKPFVKYWYSCSDGSDAQKFNQLVSKPNVDKLIERRGAAIVYTHFSKGFVDKYGTVDAKTRQILSYIARQPGGWFVPVKTILERLLQIRDLQVIENKDEYLIINKGNSEVTQLAIEVVEPSGIFYGGKLYKPDNGSHAILGIDRLGTNQILILRKNRSSHSLVSFFERSYLIFAWLFSR